MSCIMCDSNKAYITHNKNFKNMILLKCKDCNDTLLIFQYTNPIDLNIIESYKFRHQDIYPREVKQ